MIALAALSLAAAGAPCTGPVCNFDTLAPWFGRISDEARIGSPARPAHILQIGDSHTAGDALTGAWRKLLQARWAGLRTPGEGVGGRGVLPPGRPYDGYFTQGVTVTMSDGWQVAASFGKGSGAPRPPLGLSSYSLTSPRPGASMALAAAPGMAFNRFVVCGLAGPDAGSVIARFRDAYGENEATFDFARETAGPLCLESPSGEAAKRSDYPPLSKLELTVQRAPVTLTSWGSFSLGGVTLSNLGIVGSQLQHFARTDDGVLAEELRVYQPDLIVLAFGTNEGFAPHFDANGYRATLIGQIDRLRRLAPGVPLLLLGPPQALSRNPALRANAEGVVTGCPAVDPTKPPLFEPPALARVRAIQREVAQEMDFAWWDWAERMGGPCAAVRWVADGRMRGDYVHLTSAGGRAVAQLLEDDLVRFATSDQ